MRGITIFQAPGRIRAMILLLVAVAICPLGATSAAKGAASDKFTFAPHASLRLDRSNVIMNVSVNCNGEHAALLDLVLRQVQKRGGVSVGQAYSDQLWCDGTTHAFQLDLGSGFRPGHAIAVAALEDTDTGAAYATSDPTDIQITDEIDTTPVRSENIDLPSELARYKTGTVKASFGYRCKLGALTSFVVVVTQTKGVGNLVEGQTMALISAKCDGATHTRTAAIAPSAPYNSDDGFSLGRATLSVIGYRCFAEGCGARDGAARIVRLRAVR